MADVTPDPIMRIALAYMAAKHLFVASAIGLFESLAGGPATLDELATKCGVPHRTLGINIDAMASGSRKGTESPIATAPQQRHSWQVRLAPICARCCVTPIGSATGSG
jgi:hypothetical protein